MKKYLPNQLNHLSVQVTADVDQLGSELNILVLLSEELLLAVHLHDLGNLDLGRHPGLNLGSIVATFKSLSGLLQVVCLVLIMIMIMIMMIITKRENYGNDAGTSSSMVALRVSGSRPATAPSGCKGLSEAENRNQEALLVRKEMITMMINYLHELGVHDPAVRRQFNVCQSLRALAASSTWAMANLK